MNNLHNKGFPTDFLEQLKSRNDIVTTISRYIPIAKKGKTFWCNCPFHFEKTPSMAVNDVEQFYHCFGCGESGDVIKFVEKIESVDFWEAVKILAKHAGMELPAMASGDAIAAKKEKKELYLKILKEAAIYYRDNLKAQKSNAALDYLKKRGINERSVAQFGIGVSLGFDGIKAYLLSKGYKPDDCVAAGVLDKKGAQYFDCYSGRLIFPLINSFGDVVGFSGRLLENKDFAKYKNTPQTIVFDKSRTVFAINLIKKAKQQNDLKEVIVVEGQIDVISLHQAGFNNTVACLGTALTSAHARELRRFADKVILCFDGDEAGHKAAVRSIDIILDAGLSCRVAKLPGGVDPDEFVKANGAEALKKLLSNAAEAVDYKIKSLSEQYNLNSNEQKSKFVGGALDIITGLKTDSEKEIYLKELSALTGISLDVLRRDLVKKGSGETVGQAPAEHSESAAAVQNNAYIVADTFILASILHKQPFVKPEDCRQLLFIEPDFKTLLDIIQEANKQGKQFLITNIYDRFDTEQSPNINAVINYNFEKIYNPEAMYRECLLKNREQYLLLQKHKLEQEYNAERDSEKRAQVLQKLSEVIRESAELKKKIQTLQISRREE